MKTWSVFKKDTGQFIGQTFSTDQDINAPAPINFPDGHGVIEGHHDHLSKRVNIDALSRYPEFKALRAAFAAERVTSVFQDSPLEYRQKRQAEMDAEMDAALAEIGEVVIDYQPPAPTENHEWCVDTKRWRLTAAAIARTQAREAARARIAELDASSIAILRDLALGSAAALPRLQAIHDEIASLQASMA